MKRIDKISLITLALLLGSSSLPLMAQNQEVVSLTLEQCREMALKNNYRLKNSAEGVLRAKDVLGQYKTNYLPNISLNANALYSTATFSETLKGGFLPTYVPNPTTGELVPNVVGVAPDGTPILGQYAFMPDQTFEFEVGFAYNAGVQLVQPIYMGGKVSTAVKLAQRGVNVAELRESLSETEVIIEADKGYYTYLQVEDKLLSAQKYSEVIEEFYRQLSDAVDEGMATRNDLMRVEVRRNEAKLLLKRAENGLRLARMNICYIAGLPLTTRNLQLSDQLDSDNIASDLMNMNIDNLDVSQRAEYKMLQEQIAAKELEVKLSRSEYLPQISLLASYGYQNGGKLNDSPLFDGASFSGGVMVSIPLFHWGEARKKVSGSRREVNMAKNEFEDLSQKMTLELMQSLNSYQESVYELEMSEVALGQAAENMRMSKDGYDEGMETLGDYLESQALWQNAMSELVDSRASMRMSYLEYMRCTGKNLL